MNGKWQLITLIKLTVGGKNNLPSRTDKVGKWTLTVWAEGQGYYGSITGRGEWLRKSQTGRKHFGQINIWGKVSQKSRQIPCIGNMSQISLQYIYFLHLMPQSQISKSSFRKGQTGSGASFPTIMSQIPTRGLFCSLALRIPQLFHL